MNKNNILAIICLIVVAALTRLFPHPSNFAPLGGMALFGGYYFSKKWHAFVVTASSWWLADLALNNIVYKRYFPTFTWLSASFITVTVALVVIILISKILIKKPTIFTIVSASLVSSIVFYLVTNFGSFLEIYPHTMAGLSAAYTAGLPFFKNTVLGDLFYSGILFGIYYFVTNRQNAGSLSIK